MFYLYIQVSPKVSCFLIRAELVTPFIEPGHLNTRHLKLHNKHGELHRIKLHHTNIKFQTVHWTLRKAPIMNIWTQDQSSKSQPIYSSSFGYLDRLLIKQNTNFEPVAKEIPKFYYVGFPGLAYSKLQSTKH